MTAATQSPASVASGFSPRAVLALVLIGVVAFAGLSVLAVYAPDLRAGSDGGAHALSSSAVGFRGATILLKNLGEPVVLNRTLPRRTQHRSASALLVLTPGPMTAPHELNAFSDYSHLLIVMPKWLAMPDPEQPRFVKKTGVLEDRGWSRRLLSPFAPSTTLRQRPGWSRPVLLAAGQPFASGRVLPLGRIDRLQTLAGPEWVPVLTDETGGVVLAHAHAHPDVFVLADPDLLNNQGLAQLANARGGVAVIEALKGSAVVFDVTLQGFARTQSLGKLLLEPPWLAATICAAAAGMLMLLHALARFGPAHEGGRAIALGSGALVDNSAGLVRLARKEAALAPRYVDLAKALVVRAAGSDGADAELRLEALARRRGLEPPDVLAAEAARATTPDDVLALGRKLYRWRREMTRDGR